MALRRGPGGGQVFSGWLIDNSRLLPECVRTQVKRAYESSVCLAQASTIETRYRVGGCAEGFGTMLGGCRKGPDTASDV